MGRGSWQVMPRHTRFRIALVLFVALPCAAPLAGQVQVNRVDDIRFGNVLGGVANTVLRTDPARAGRFDIITPPGVVINGTFVLPPVMTRAGGGTMPISFAGTTAGYSDAQSIGSQVGFNPQFGGTVTATDGRASVFMGATVTPAVGQAPGSYTATITLIVVIM
jgi:hypothetical protein